MTEAIRWILSDDQDNLACPICQDCFDTNEKQMWTRIKCGHSFHTECLEEWTQSKLNTDILSRVDCPMCGAEYLNVRSRRI